MADVVQQGVFMEDGSVASNLSTVTKSLDNSSVEPAREFLSALFVLDLFIVFDIVKDNKAWTAAHPLTTADLLFSASSKDSECIPIRALHHYVSFLILDKALDLEVSNEIIVFAKLVSDVAKMLDGGLLRGADQDNIAFRPEQNIR
jgi:hypothetical protein